MSFQADGIPSIGVVVPITRMAGKLSNLMNWIPAAIEIGMRIYLIHDVQDSETSEELTELIKSFDSNQISLVEGIFRSPGLARNRGLEKSQEDWVYFWDADDIPNPGFALSMLRNIPKEMLRSKDIVVGQYKVVESNNLREIAVSKAHYSEDLNFQDLARNVGLWRCAFRRSAILHKFNDTKMGEDQKFLESNIDVNKTIFVQDYIYEYVVGVEGQLTSQKKNMSDLLRNNNPHTLNNLEDPTQFHSILAVKQLLSLLKSGGGWIRVRAFLRLLGKFIRFPREIFIHTKFIVSNSGYGAASENSRRRKFVLTGGLGNQLFQIMAALSTSSDGQLAAFTSFGKPRVNINGSPDSFDFRFPFELTDQKTNSSWFINKVVGYSLRSGIQPRWFEKTQFAQTLISLNGSVALSLHLGEVTSVRRARDVGYQNLGKIDKHSILIGYFQSHLYMERNPMVRLAMEKLRVTNPSKELQRLVNLVSEVRPTVVHIRLGDYIAEKDFGILGPEYYKEATKILNGINPSRTYWIFSDDIQTAKLKYGSIFGDNCYWVTEVLQNSVETLELMRHGTDFVIANSTFSWWAASLAYDRKSKVISPNRWFAGLPEPKAIIPPEWIRIESDFL